MKGDIYQQIGLRQLELQEVGGIELFAIGNFAGQAGLPAPDCPEMETSEEEHERDDLMVDIISEAYWEGRDLNEALVAAGFPRR